MMENQQVRQKLQDELRKLFQFDLSDLDFGIYRILNRKKDQIEQFIEKDLPDAVNEGLEKYRQQDTFQVDEIKQQIIDSIGLDTDNIYHQRGGIPSALISLLQRYMHSPSEMVSLQDIEALKTLMTETILGMEPDQAFTVL